MVNTPGTYELACAFINSTNRNVLLTGKAGTGKTTLLRSVCKNTLKNTVVVAPTGVAAINAGGSTIHSFFSLPFHPYLPTPQSRHGLIAAIKLSNEKKQLLQSIELLIIDEVSMVRCDILDAIDVLLKVSRNRPNLAFGGVQVLLIGDMYQLPPVVRPTEWNILKTKYSSQYFFDSHVLLDNPPVFIELDVVFRQKDPAFITLLNQVRNNVLDLENYQLLHSRLRINHKVSQEDMVTLTTHNHLADSINKKELEKLPAQLFSFRSLIEGNFQPSNYPADETFVVKEGAKVMFLKNDQERSKRFYNGKTGTVKKINADEIIVDDGTGDITVKKETWKNIRYSINRSTGKMEEEELGSFIQYPLRLAWAITIHKSQGLTFDKVLIDAGTAFAPGQVYVALSRCRSLEGIYLSKRIESGTLMTDPVIVKYASAQASNTHAAELLPAEMHAYELFLLFSVFRFEDAEGYLKELSSFAKAEPLIYSSSEKWLAEITESFTEINNTSKKFIKVVESLTNDQSIPEPVQERIKAASGYFSPLVSQLMQRCGTCPVMLDNRKLAADFNERANRFIQQLHFSGYIIGLCRDGFSLNKFLAGKKAYVKTADLVNVYENVDTGNESDAGNVLYRMLIEKRNELAESENRPRYLIISTVSLKQMSELLPVTIEQLNTISGFGKVKIRQYGKIFLDVVTEFCEANNITPEFKESKPKVVRVKKHPVSSATKNSTYDLFIAGKTISDIAKERNLAPGTIESHLAAFVEKGLLKIEALMDEKRFTAIHKVLMQNKEATLAQLKEQLPDYSYSELRFASAHTKFTAGSN